MAQARSFEESALVLGHNLRGEGHRDLAAALLELVSEAGSVRDEAHRILVAGRLSRIAAAEHVAPRLREQAARLADLATSDGAVRRRRTGTVWVGSSGHGEQFKDFAGEDLPEPGYQVSWQSDRGDDDWCENGPHFTNLRDALSWARTRTDAVIVRPAWDEDTHYWAGQGHDPRNLPPLVSRAPDRLTELRSLAIRLLPA